MSRPGRHEHQAIEEGLTLVRREYPTAIGPIDLGFGKADNESTKLYINAGLAF